MAARFSRTFALGLLLLVLVPSEPVRSQFRDVRYTASLTASAATEGQLPFWLAANRYGTVDPSGANGGLRAGVVAPGRLGPLGVTLGVDLVGRASDRSTLYAHQYYALLDYGPFRLRAGRQEEITGEVDPLLSMGSMTWSPNAAPMTKIGLSWPDFVPIPGTRGFVEIKGSLAHGWVEGNRIVNRSYLHEKSVYLRFGGDRLPVQGWAGILHYALWAGTHVDPRNGDLPDSYNDYLRVVFVQGGKVGTVVDGETTNVLGNSIGAYDFGIRARLATLRLMAYRQMFLEDTVSLAMRNVWDGLWGLSIHFDDTDRLVTGVLWEHANTKRQSSYAHEPIGTDNYYNHGLYGSGWTHRGRTIGLPLLFTQPDSIVGVRNNILIAHHVGVMGQLLPGLRYTAFATYSRNYGAHGIRRDFFEPRFSGRFRDENGEMKPMHQYAVMLQFNAALSPSSPYELLVRTAVDWGDLSPKSNVGLTLGLVRTGVLGRSDR